MKFDRILVGSKNPAKVQRYRHLLARCAHAVIGCAEIGLTQTPRESGSTAEENAAIKARFYAAHSGIVSFAEDAALFVDFLPPDQQPGVYVRRIHGAEEASDDALFEHWAAMVSSAPQEQRAGRWHTAYCIAFPDGTTRALSHDHPIRFFWPPSPRRIPGWPISSLEGPAQFNKPHSEMTQAEMLLLEETVDRAILEELCSLNV